MHDEDGVSQVLPPKRIWEGRGLCLSWCRDSPQAEVHIHLRGEGATPAHQNHMQHEDWDKPSLNLSPCSKWPYPSSKFWLSISSSSSYAGALSTTFLWPLIHPNQFFSATLRSFDSFDEALARYLLAMEERMGQRLSGAAKGSGEPRHLQGGHEGCSRRVNDSDGSYPLVAAR